MDEGKLFEQLCSSLEAATNKVADEVKSTRIELKEELRGMEHKLEDSFEKVDKRIRRIETEQIERRTKERILVWVVPFIITLLLNGAISITKDTVEGNKPQPAIIQQKEQSE